MSANLDIDGMEHAEKEKNDVVEMRTPERVNGVVNEPAEIENCYMRYDYCVVMRTSEHKSISKLTSRLLSDWDNIGLENYVYIPADRTMVFILLRAKSVDVLRDFAEKIGFQMILSATALESALANMKIEINSEVEYSKYSPYDCIYVAYKRNIENLFIMTPEYNEDMIVSQSNPFSMSCRIKLIELMLLGGEGRNQATYEFNIKRLLRMGHIYSYFPMPDQWSKKELRLSNADILCCKPLPTNDISDYFGSKINLYFQFASHIASYMMFPAVVSIAFQLAVLIKMDFAFPVGPFFAVMISAWAGITLRMWIRKENEISLAADTENFEEMEVNRPEYHGLRIKSFIDGSDYRYFSTKKYFCRKIFGALIITCCSLFSIACVAGIYYLQFKLQNTSLGSSVQSISSVINVLMIVILSQIFSLISTTLTNWENHRTDTVHEDSLAAKTFVFQFINAFSSFFFIAFVAQWLAAPENAAPEVRGQCAYQSCVTTLAINLAIIVGTRLIVTNTLRFLGNAVYWCCCERRRVDLATISEAEIEFRKKPFEPTSYLLQQYSELAVVFGHVVLFSSALPIVVCFAYIIYYLEVRFDLFDLVYKYQRPNIAAGEDIGVWQSIFQCIAAISVVTNAGLIVYTMDNIREYSEVRKAFIFIGIQWVIFGLYFAFNYFVPEVPQDVATQYQRSDFITKVALAGKDLTPYIRQPQTSLNKNTSKNGTSSASTPLKASSRIPATPATTMPSFKIHEGGPSYVPLDKLPFSPSRSTAQVQPESVS